MSPLSRAKRTIYFVALSIVFVIGVPVLLLYTAGYRLSLDRNIDVRGGLYVYAPEAGSKIFIDGELQEESTFFNRRFFSQNLKGGVYTVVVDHPSHKTWTKQVRVRPNRVTSLRPFMLNEQIDVREIEPITYDFDEEGMLIRQNNPLYLQLVERFLLRKAYRDRQDVLRVQNGESVPLENSAINSNNRNNRNNLNTVDGVDVSPRVIIEPVPPLYERGHYVVWVEDDSIYAQYSGGDDWVPEYFCDMTNVELDCVDTIRLFASTVPIKQIDFFPGEDSALLVRLEDGIYVVEVDIRAEQFFEKLYDGPSDDFYISENNRVFIINGREINELVLE
jgi:hypothetical protein